MICLRTLKKYYYNLLVKWIMEAVIEGFSVDEKYRYVNTKSNPENIRAAVFKGVV